MIYLCLYSWLRTCFWALSVNPLYVLARLHSCVQSTCDRMKRRVARGSDCLNVQCSRASSSKSRDWLLRKQICDGMILNFSPHQCLQIIVSESKHLSCALLLCPSNLYGEEHTLPSSPTALFSPMTFSSGPFIFGVKHVAGGERVRVR